MWCGLKYLEKGGRSPRFPERSMWTFPQARLLIPPYPKQNSHLSSQDPNQTRILFSTRYILALHVYCLICIHFFIFLPLLSESQYPLDIKQCYVDRICHPWSVNSLKDTVVNPWSVNSLQGTIVNPWSVNSLQGTIVNPWSVNSLKGTVVNPWSVIV